MTAGAPIQIEGNLAEIDDKAKYFLLQARDGTTNYKVFYGPAQEENVKKHYLKAYNKPTVTPIEGQQNEFNLVDLPFCQRPVDFPKMKTPDQHRGGGGGRPYVPRNEKAMMFNNALQVFGALYVGRLGNNSSGQNWDTSVESVIKAAEEAVKRGSIAAGVQ